MISISVLGPVELHRDGVAVPVRPGKTTELLVRLALEAGRHGANGAADRGPLGGGGGGHRPQPVADQGFAAATVARRRLAGHRDESRVRAQRRARAQSTRSRFSAWPARRRRRGSSDPAAALALCTTALAMFHGDVLPDAGDGEWVVPYRVRLDEARLGLVEDQLAAQLDLGGAGEVVAELEALLSRYPLRERLWASLITALYRSGRQADALGAYTRVREALVEQLGLEPGPALRALEQQVLLQDPALDGARPSGRTGSSPSSQPSSGAHLADDRPRRRPRLPSADSRSMNAW